MNSTLRTCLLSFLVMILSVFANATYAQSGTATVVALSPAGNAINVPVNLGPTGVTITLNQNWATGITAQNSSVFVHSLQAGGKKAGSYNVTGASNTFTPGSPFKPGETVFTTITTASGLASSYVYQFTTAVAASPGTFVPGVNYGAGASTISVAAADVDNDGDLDILTADYGANTVSVLKNNGNGTFATATSFETGSLPHGVAAADMDGDGDLDILTANILNTVSVLMNNGNGSFAAAANLTAGSAPTSVAAADVDGDGDMDILTANSSSNNVSVLKNNGNGSFAAAVNLTVGKSPRSVAAADMDGDGDLDILTANFTKYNDGDASQNSVSMLKNLGNGTFAEVENINGGYGCQGVIAANVDGDGDLDIVTADYGGNTITVLKNNGNGTFAPRDNYASGSGPTSLVAGDIDGDGDLDILIPNSEYDNMSVLKNKGNGTFAAPVKFTVGNSPRSVAAADVDGDGDLDILTANLGPNTVSVLKNGVVSISSLSPGSGAEGTTVTITGTHFSGATGVSFNGKAATSFTVNSDSQITTTVPTGATSGNVVVLNSAGGSNGVSFTVFPPPTITSLSPGSGAVGTTVTITGTNFTGATGVTFNGKAATNFTVNSATQITATVPAVASGNVVVTTAGGSSTGASFTVGPYITSLTPNSGDIGRRIGISGANFSSNSTVTVNNVSAPILAYSTTLIQIGIPTGAVAGANPVVVRDNNLISNSVTFTVPSPAITSISPNSGPVGTNITITGTNFGAGSTVTIGGVSASITSSSPTRIKAIVPGSLNAGPHAVMVTNNGFSSNAVDFTVSPLLTISSLSPTSGAVGTSVTITGTNFPGATGVTFNGTVATSFTINSATQITATVPVGATTGNIVVITPGGSSTGVSFTVLEAPTITFADIEKTYGDVDFNLSSMSNSSGAITYSVVSGTGATVTPNGVVTITGVGSVVVMASQAAVGNFTAGEVNSTLTINKASNTISFTNPGTKTYGDAAFDLTALAASGGAINFSVVSGPATISGNTLTLTGAGEIMVEASSGETANYLAATDQSITFTVNKATAGISFSGLTPAYDGSAKSVTATTVPARLSGVSITYNNSTTAPVDAGSYNISATLTNDNYELASTNDPATATLQIAPASNSINFDALSDKTYGNADFTLGATSSSGLLVTYTATGNATIINGNTVHITGAGSAAITAHQAGTNNYMVAADVEQTFTIIQKQLTPSFTASDKDYDGTVAATIIYRSLTGGTVGSDEVSLGATGTATFADVNAGIGKTVSANGFALAGAAARNYSLTETSATTTATIDKATASVSLSGLTGQVYTGLRLSAGSATIPSGLTVNIIYDGNTQAPTDAGSYTVEATINENNYKGSASGTLVISKAASVTTVMLPEVAYTYNGSAQTPATVTVTGAGGLSITPTATYSNNTDAGTAIASYNYAGDGNHEVSGDSQTFAISKAPTKTVVTIAGSPFNYTGSAITPATVSVTGAGSLSLTPGALYTNNINAGTATATYTYAGDANHTGSEDSKIFVIGRADAVIKVTPYNVAYNGAAHTAIGTAKGVKLEDLSGLTLTGTTHTEAGTYATDAWTYTDVTGNYNNASGTVSDIITKVQLTITANNKSKVYDGKSYTDGGGVFTSGYSGFIAGESESNITITGNITYSGTATTAIDASTTPYIITPVITGLSTANYTFSPANGTLTINKAEACITYNGDLFKNTTSTTGGSAIVNLSVVITSNSGDISTAQIVEFYVDGTAVSGTITKTWNQATPDQVSYSIPYTVNLSNTELSKTFDITWDLEGNYLATESCSDQATQITVSAPSADFITGGGYIKLTNSYGKYAGDAGSKNNFGFSVKWNKKFSSLQGGGINSIIRKGTIKYQIKGTKVTALTVTSKTATAPATASFTSNAVVSTIVNGEVVSSEGNCTAIVEISDICEPGSGAIASSDQIAITVKDKNGVVIYSSKWDATTKKTIKQTLNGGNIQIHNSSTTDAPTCTSPSVTLSRSLQMNTAVPKVITMNFELKVFPNPSATQFNVQPQSSNTTDKITLRVFDISGRTVQVIPNLDAGQTIQLGNKYRPGIYFVEMIQGKNLKQVKLVKTID